MTLAFYVKVLITALISFIKMNSGSYCFNQSERNFLKIRWGLTSLQFENQFYFYCFFDRKMSNHFVCAAVVLMLWGCGAR
jgi:hypothetical protein